MNIALLIEESIWGVGNVPPIILRNITNDKTDLSHEGHYQCTDVDCIL